ncbi:MAG: hypothetical protein QUV08_00535 [Parasphingorhabdus sp.]|nr:hypothetical protein [Parasphingorhabdus sp.]
MLPVLPVNAPYHHGDLRAAALQMGMESWLIRNSQTSGCAPWPAISACRQPRSIGTSRTRMRCSTRWPWEGLSRLGHSQAEAADSCRWR